MGLAMVLLQMNLDSDEVTLSHWILVGKQTIMIKIIGIEYPPNKTWLVFPGNRFLRDYITS
ncbi:MAG: hypothetical protein CM1200mP38_4660 [Dehalococcoidia bacterium]|nr:MAG: hypothetical protein CM1200mP38_4660 [Dehalococcoidia bacterium]